MSQKTKDMTRGPVMKQVLLFSLPFLIGNVFQQLYNIADMVIVGRTLGPEAYAAVGATGSLIWFASGAIQSLTVGFSVIAAQYFGAGEKERIKEAFGASILLSSIISVALAVICVIFARPILVLLRTPDELLERSYRYVVWIFAGLIATALYNLLSNMIRSLGDSRTPLYFLVIACLINILLDFVFILLCGMDTDGAGLATILAQLISGILCIFYIKWKHPMLHIGLRHLRWNGMMNRRLLHVAVPMAFLNMVLSIGSVVMQFVTNGLGTVYVASQTTGSKIETFVTMPILSFGSAVSVFAAQNYGAKRYDRVLEGSRKTALACFVWNIIATLIMVPFGVGIIRLLAGDVGEVIVSNAYKFIVLNTALTFILTPLVVWKSVLQAVGRTTWTMISGFTEIVGRAGVAILVLALTAWTATVGDDLGFTVMCFANPMAWLLGLLTILGDYVGMKRKFKKLMKTNREDGEAPSADQPSES